MVWGNRFGCEVQGCNSCKAGSSQSDTTSAAIVVGKDGAIKEVKIDVTQVKNAFNDKGVVSPAAGLKSKKEVKFVYKMSGVSGIKKEWFEQEEALEQYLVGKTLDDVKSTESKLFSGKTTAEIKAWFDKYTVANNGRPLTSAMTNKAAKAKYDSLSEADKKILADITAGASMSINDPHVDMVNAIKKAYTNKVAVDGTKIAKIAVGKDAMLRKGSGTGADEQVWSFNLVFLGKKL